MSKITCRMEIDLETLEYEIYFENASKKSEEIDFHEIRSAMIKVFTDWGNKLEEGIDSTDKVIKNIH